MQKLKDIKVLWSKGTLMKTGFSSTTSCYHSRILSNVISNKRLLNRTTDLGGSIHYLIIQGVAEKGSLVQRFLKIINFPAMVIFFEYRSFCIPSQQLDQKIKHTCMALLPISNSGGPAQKSIISIGNNRGVNVPLYPRNFQGIQRQLRGESSNQQYKNQLVSLRFLSIGHFHRQTIYSMPSSKW